MFIQKHIVHDSFMIKFDQICLKNILIVTFSPFPNSQIVQAFEFWNFKNIRVLSLIIYGIPEHD